MSASLLVTGRVQSTRLPGKLLLPFGGATVIQFVVERAARLGMPVWLCTSTDEEDDALVAAVNSSEVQCFRGHPTNKLRRWHDAAERTGSDVVHLLDADDPFFDVNEVSDSIELLKQDGLDIVRPSVRSDQGMASVGTSTTPEFLRALTLRAKELVHDNLDTIPWNAIRRPPDRWSVMPDRSLGYLPNDARLTLDYIEDYELLSELASRFGADAPRLFIERFLSQHPRWTSINSMRTREFLYRQESQRRSLTEGNQ